MVEGPLVADGGGEVVSFLLDDIGDGQHQSDGDDDEETQGHGGACRL